MHRARPLLAMLSTAISPIFGACASHAASSVDSGADAATSADAQTDSSSKVDVNFTPLKAELKSDLQYRTVAGKALLADFYLPDRSAPAPVVVQIHGGGFSSGDKAGLSEVNFCEHFQSNGIAALSINYRVYSDYPPDGYGAFPNSLYDVKCSIMWLRKHADEFGIDKNHIFVLGSSAGGYFTNMLGTSGNDPTFDPPDCVEGAGESNAVQGAITYFGPGADWTAMFSDPLRVGTQNSEKKFLSLTTACTNTSDIDGICKTASAVTHIDAADPPFFISHSDDDPGVPVTQGRIMKSSLEAKKVNVTYREVIGKGHGWHARFSDPEIAAVRDEVTAWVKTLAAK